MSEKTGAGYMGDRSGYDHSMSDRYNRGRSSVVPMSDGSNNNSNNNGSSRSSNQPPSLLTGSTGPGGGGGSESAAYQVGQYVHSRARSSKRKKQKDRKKKLSLSPMRSSATTTRSKTMEESSLRKWRDFNDFDEETRTSTSSKASAAGSPPATTTGRPSKTPPRSKSNDDSLTLMRGDSDRNFAAYAASKYVLRSQEEEEDPKKRSPSPTSYVPSGMDPEDENADPNKNKLGTGFQDVDDVEAIQRNFYTLGETSLEKSQKNQRRQQICWTILFCKLVLVGGVGLIASIFLHVQHQNDNLPSAPSLLVTLSPATATTEAPVATTTTSAPKEEVTVPTPGHKPVVPQTKETTQDDASASDAAASTPYVAQTSAPAGHGGNTKHTPSSASNNHNTGNAGSSSTSTSTSAPAAHHHLPFPPADEAALDLFCDNEKVEKDGYAECERLCLAASCCWSNNPSTAACQDSDAVRNQCTKYNPHCSILNQSY